MKNHLFHIGIDISKLKLDVVVVKKETPNESYHFIVENNLKGIKSIISVLKKKKTDLESVLFCFENTGVYTFPLSRFCSETKLDYWIVPAIEIKRSKGISRGKNDKTDAKDIALYSIRNIDKLKLSVLPETEIQQLKLLFAEREKLMKSLLMFESSKENENYTSKSVYKSVQGVNTKTIQFLKTALKAIEKKMKDVITNKKELKQQFELMKTIPGVGERTAIYFIIVTKGFTAFDSARKLACYAGVAPFEYSSGTSIRSRTKVNHMADKKMKSLLQMCALSAIKCDSQIKEYYIKKQNEGKNKMLVLNNIRSKIISRIFAVINRQSSFINTYKFAN